MLQDGVNNITILSHGLPKTGQETSHATNDDGNCEIGWWIKRKVVDNRTRFIVKTLDGDEVVIDLATGLMWARDGDEAGCNSGGKLNWINCITYCNGLSFAGYSNWRLPNMQELFSITNQSTWNPAIWDSFTNVKWDTLTWTSTTRPFSTTYARAVHFSEGTPNTKLKTTAYYLRSVRGFT